ncbi:phenylalanyl-tRNA synthetase subunit alpha [Gloeomargarita lithophora Alchichica-D10]|uniref:Phenylalanine--tRNA ligase alpha subunit n=1 Tax=Gloeomargarita lithophora Alchichica-D10 TaxID=1188229 RepID=A0A1J0A8Z6_9CYAN|nr:phenylalanine--tRNA ligase subunit alpha [Gloeomargarita lithophora]APB32398.1 phenylalanyl-tRNA synthetase subunit alpha [Gloeomargarita lithophora Alchichica-D10]
MAAQTFADLAQALQDLENNGLAAIAEAASPAVLEQLRVDYLGKKGGLSQVLRGMGQLPPAERPQVGALANQVKDRLQEALGQRVAQVQAQALETRLQVETLDVTMPGLGHAPGHSHPLQQTLQRVLDIFVGLGYQVVQGPEVETDYYNFAALNFLPDHPARDMQDTYYLPDGRLLRTHTSTVQIRYMETHQPPLRIVVPGRVYRRDTVDATHSAMFHQVEILAVERGLTFTDLQGTLVAFIQALFGEVPVRFRASYFPFTEPSAEVDLQWRGRWLEVLGCGLVDPNVLQAVGYDPEQYTGFAAGLGIERLAMICHEIDDIRRFYTSDLRFLTQF